MQNIRGQNRKKKKLNPRDYKKILTLALVGLLIVNLIPGSVFADVWDGTDTAQMTEVSDIEADTVADTESEIESETESEIESETESIFEENASEETINDGLDENAENQEETTKQIEIGDTSEYDLLIQESEPDDVSEESNMEEGNENNAILRIAAYSESETPESENGESDEKKDPDKNDESETKTEEITEPPTKSDYDEAIKDNENEQENEPATAYSSAGIVIEEDDEGALKYATGFSVSSATGQMDGSAVRKILDYAGVYPSSYQITAYDLKLMAEGNEIEPSGRVKVALSSGVYSSGYSNYKFYIFEGGSPTELGVSIEGGYAFYYTRSFERIYIYGYNISNSSEEDEETPKQDTDKKDTDKTDTDKTDTDKTDTDKTDTDKTDTDKTDTDKTDPDKTDPDKTDPDKTDPDKTDTDKTDTDKKDTDKTDPDKTDTDTDDEYVTFTLTATVALDGEKNTQAGTVEIKNYSAISPKEEVSIEAKAKKTSKSKITFLATALEGYNFVGWFADIEAKDDPITTDTELVVSEFTDSQFYAVFTVKEEKKEDEKQEEKVETVYVKAYVAVDGEKSTKAGTIAVLNTSIKPKSSLVLQVSTAETGLSFEAEEATDAYTFLGWYEDINGEGDCLTTDAVLNIEKVEEKIYYAVFKKVEVETIDVKAYVAYNGEKSTAAGKIIVVDSNYTAKSSLNIEVTKGQKYALETYTNSDYTFKGWYSNINGEGQAITTSQTLTVTANEDAVFYAVYERYVEIKVGFVEESSGKMGKITVNDDSDVRIKRGESFTLKAVANDGYKFMGWYDDKNASGTTSISSKAEYSIKVSSGTSDTSITYYAYFKEIKKSEPKVTLTSGGVKLNTDGLTLKKGYYQLTSTDITSYECPIKYSSWYKFTQAGIDEEVVSINGENGYLIMSALTDGTVVEINKRGWYTFFFKDTNDVVYTVYILVEDDNNITIPVVKETAPKTTTADATKNTVKASTTTTNNKTTTAKNTTKKTTATSTQKPKEPEKQEEVIAAYTDKLLIDAVIEQKISDDEEPKMLLSYVDEVVSGEKITKFVYGYVGEEEPKNCYSWYQMVAGAQNIVQIRDVNVIESTKGRRFEFPVDQVGWYYICVSNEESGDQYYKAYLSDYVSVADEDELELSVNGAYVTASLINGEVAYIKEKSDQKYSKGNRIKVTDIGENDIYVINTKGQIYQASIEIGEDILQKTVLTQYIIKLQELLDSVTPLSEEEFDTVYSNGQYVLQSSFDYADSIRYEGAQILEYSYSSQYEIEYETNKVKEAYEELKQEMLVIDNDLVSVNVDNDVTIKAKEGEFLTYVLYPVDKDGRITPSLWTNYAGITSGQYVRVTEFESDESITFRNLKPGIYSFAIRTEGQVKYRSAIVCDSGESEISMIEYELEKTGGLFETATGLLRGLAGDDTLYSCLSNELQKTYNAFDIYVNDNQVGLFLDQVSKLNNIVLKVQRMTDAQDIENLPITTKVTRKSEEKETPGITIQEIK